MDESEPIEPVAEPKTVEDIAKRYMESQKELMEMIFTLYAKWNKIKEL